MSTNQLNITTISEEPTEVNKKLPLAILVTVGLLLISLITCAMFYSLFNMNSTQNRYIFLGLVIIGPSAFFILAIAAGRYYVYKNKEFELYKETQGRLKRQMKLFSLWHSSASYDLNKAPRLNTTN